MFFPDGVASEFEFVSVVKKTVTNGIGDGGVANGGVPVRGWQLAGNDGGNGLMPGGNVKFLGVKFSERTIKNLSGQSLLRTVI